MRPMSYLNKIVVAANRVLRTHLYLEKSLEEQKILLGRLWAQSVKAMEDNKSLDDVEFSVFSQWGDDGIIQYLTNQIDIPSKIFVELGVGDYRESNTRFLLMNDNWSGLVLDSSPKNVKRIKRSHYYWKYDLRAKAVFVDRENINQLIVEDGFHNEIGLLNIDVNGNDYWIWEAINVIEPIIVVMEYNSVFGNDRAISIPYENDFRREKAHYSYLYFGASLPAFYHLGLLKGYCFVGCNSAGINAFFVREDKLGTRIKEVSLDMGYVESKIRDSRDRTGKLSYVSGDERLELIQGLPVINVKTGQIEKL